MPVFRRELAFNANRPMEHTGDWWHLVLDTDNSGLWIEHSWSRASRHRDGAVDRGEQRFGVNDFLSLTNEQLAHAALLIALKDMFREPKPTPEEGGAGSLRRDDG